MPLRIHCLQHVPFEGPAYVATWAQDNGHSMSFTKFWVNDRLPDLKAFDWLLIMGGPMNIDDDDRFAWLSKEKEFVSKCIARGKTIIGICLGAQLLAHCAGAKVFKNPQKEIGWFPLTVTDEGKSILGLPEESIVFHWHGDTFELPEGAIRLAENEACKNQAFLLNDNVLGLQFHCEMTEESLKEITEACFNEIVEDEYVQSAASILSQSHLCTQSNQYMKQLLDKMTEKNQL